MRRKKPVATNIAPASLYSYLSARGAKGDDLACPTGGFSVMQDHHNHDKGQSGNDPHGLPSHNRQHHQHDQASAANAGVELDTGVRGGCLVMLMMLSVVGGQSMWIVPGLPFVVIVMVLHDAEPSCGTSEVVPLCASCGQI